MQDFVGSLPDGVIDLDLEETKLHVSTDQYKSVVNGIVADDFPVMPSMSDGNSWTVDAATFKKALSHVVFAASSDETRPILTSVLLQSINKELVMAATDSYRLAEKKLGKVSKDIKVLIPASAMQDLLRVLGDDVEEVQIKNDQQQVQFKVGDIELVSRQIDGNYPEYQNLIPKSFQLVPYLNELIYLMLQRYQACLPEKVLAV